VIWN